MEITRSASEIFEQIKFLKTIENNYLLLSKKYPNDFDYRLELYGIASKIFILEWMLK